MVVIIGAGISGLAAAFELTSRGVPFRLLEADARPGGLLRTDTVDGLTIDAGPDSLLLAKPAAAALCGELGLTPRLQEMQQPRTAFVLHRDRLFPLPSPSILGVPLTARAALGFGLLPLGARLRLLAERFVPAAAPGDESIDAFFTRRFGAAAAALVARPLLGGIHAGDTRQLSVASLFPDLQAAERSGSVLRALARRGGGATFASLSGGMETLAQALVAKLPADAQRYGVDVRGISRSGVGWAVDTATGVERADAVVFATPMPVTARLIARVAARAGALLSEIPHASTVGVALSWPRRAVPHPLAGSGFVVVPGGRVRMTACTWISSKWAGRAPADQVLLRAFVGGVHDPDAIGLTDDQIVETACHNLGSVLGIASRPTLSRVYRWREASPQLNVGHDERVRGVASELGRFPGLFVTGRGFRAVGIPDCIADARRAAAAAADYVRSHAHAKVDEHVRR